MIEIQKDATGLPDVDPTLLKLAINSTLATLEKEMVDLTLRLTDDAEIQNLNEAFRGESKPTDVLSFNQDFTDPETGRFYLGDIVISLDQAASQAVAQNHSLSEECAFLVIHGTLHLLGYDHYEPEEKAEMWALQDSIFQNVLLTHREEHE